MQHRGVKTRIANNNLQPRPGCGITHHDTTDFITEGLEHHISDKIFHAIDVNSANIKGSRFDVRNRIDYLHAYKDIGVRNHPSSLPGSSNLPFKGLQDITRPPI
jgi:hypothetical protein